MKIKASVLALTAVLILGLSTNALAVNSFNFLGETTWKIHITESTGQVPPVDLDMKGAISKLGLNYYLFQGYVQMPVIPNQPQENPFFLAGGGTLVTMPDQTQKLVLTLNTSQLHVDTPMPSPSSERDTGIMHVEINPADLSGTFYEIGHDFNRTPGGGSVGSFDPPRFTAGTLSTAAPIPLSPSVMAPLNSLLLQ